jgi:RNA recognition motif-containing protein
VLPDNCFADCNLFVKNIDLSFDAQDLYNIFVKYGIVKSAKLSLIPSSHVSRGYGFVWFATEEATHKAMADAEEKLIPFSCSLY